MKCRDVRAVTDALVSGELPAETETNDQLQQHLQSCPSCRADIEDRRRLRAGLRCAINGAPSTANSRFKRPMNCSANNSSPLG